MAQRAGRLARRHQALRVGAAANKVGDRQGARVGQNAAPVGGLARVHERAQAGLYPILDPTYVGMVGQGARRQEAWLASMSAPRRASLSSVATSGAWQMSRNSGTRRASRNTCRARFRSHRPVPVQEGFLGFRV